MKPSVCMISTSMCRDWRQGCRSQGGEIYFGRSVDAAAGVVEDGAVAGAVEGGVDGVPFHDALHVGAHSCKENDHGNVRYGNEV